MTEEASAGALIAQALKSATSSPLFTLNGGHIWPIYLGCQEQGIPIVDVRHEQTAGFAAEGAPFGYPELDENESLPCDRLRFGDGARGCPSVGPGLPGASAAPALG